MFGSVIDQELLMEKTPSFSRRRRSLRSPARFADLKGCSLPRARTSFDSGETSSKAIGFAGKPRPLVLHRLSAAHFGPQDRQHEVPPLL
jgi:hypothetical protein